MEALFFGESLTPLYGVYHPAKAGIYRDEGIVICCPFGQEYMRAHRALRQLANTFSQLGYHVLRFDYRGTGDSAEDMAMVNPRMWIDDVGHAMEELRGISGVTQISLLGLRVGALLAGVVASQESTAHRLVLWDPVVSGDLYLKEICSSIERCDSENEKRSNFIDSQGTIHFNGFALTQSFQEELAGLDLRDFSTRVSKNILQIVSHESPDFLSLKESWGRSDTYNYRLVPAPHDWNYVDHVGGILLPVPVMQTIKEWFS